MRHPRFLAALAAVPGLILATPGTAVAEPPEINKQYCTALGGTYTSDRGVKACTTTTYTTAQEVFADGPVLVAGDDPDWPLGMWEYTGSYVEEVTTATHTTEWQLANRPVTTSISTEEVSRVLVGGGCRRILVDPVLGLILKVEDEEFHWAHCQEVGLFVGLGTPVPN